MAQSYKLNNNLYLMASKLVVEFELQNSMMKDFRGISKSSQQNKELKSKHVNDTSK